MLQYQLSEDRNHQCRIGRHRRHGPYCVTVTVSVNRRGPGNNPRISVNCVNASLRPYLTMFCTWFKEAKRNFLHKPIGTGTGTKLLYFSLWVLDVKTVNFETMGHMFACTLRTRGRPGPAEGSSWEWNCRLGYHSNTAEIGTHSWFRSWVPDLGLREHKFSTGMQNAERTFVSWIRIQTKTERLRNIGLQTNIYRVFTGNRIYFFYFSIKKQYRWFVSVL